MYVADEEVVAARCVRLQPDVGREAAAAGGEGVVEGHTPPVVVMGVDGDGLDASAEVGGEGV